MQTAITGIEATVLIEGSNGISGTYSGDILSSGTAATADAPILSKFVKKLAYNNPVLIIFMPSFS